MFRILHTLNKPDRPVGEKQERKLRDKMRTGKMAHEVKYSLPSPMA